MSKFSLYLHIPFCATRCGYCDFATAETKGAEKIAEYLRALDRDLNLGAIAYGLEGAKVETIYFGGGTPSLLAADEVEWLLARVCRLFDVQPGSEITMECNPGRVGFRMSSANDPTESKGKAADWLAAVRGAGVNRLSVGVQSADERLLAMLDRRHGIDEARDFFAAARAAGFENLSLDLMYGLPHQSMEDWESSLTEVLAWKPEHVSFYALEVHRMTPMESQMKEGRLPAPDADLAADQYDAAVPMLEAAGLKQYEISNFALPGRESRHNLAYWLGKDYFGAGLSAHSCLGDVRFWRTRSMTDYMRRLERNELPEGGRERLSFARAKYESLMLRLRLTAPIQKPWLEEMFGADAGRLMGNFEGWVNQGLMQGDEREGWRFTSKGFMVSNALMSECLPG